MIASENISLHIMNIKKINRLLFVIRMVRQVDIWHIWALKSRGTLWHPETISLTKKLSLLKERSLF